MELERCCLKWRHYTDNMLNMFENLLSTETFVDVTLACDGQSLKAHKMVLSACSPYFHSLFLENPCEHPIVIMKDINYEDLKAIVSFMYTGEVTVSQDKLLALLQTAETLKVNGLTEMNGKDCQSLGFLLQDVTLPQQNSIPIPTSNSMPQPQPERRKVDSTEMHGKRKRGRPRKRSRSNLKSSDKLVPTNMHSSLNSFSSKHLCSNAQIEEPSSGEENDFNVDPSQLFEQTLTMDNVPYMSNAASYGNFILPSSSGMERTEPMSGGNKALVPVLSSSDSLSSSHLQGPDSCEDLKLIVHYMDESSLPGPSSYSDICLVQHDTYNKMVPSKIKDGGNQNHGAHNYMLRSRSNSSRGPMHSSVNSFSSKHSSSNARIEKPSSEEDDKFKVEPSKLFEQTLTTDNVPYMSNAASSGNFNIRSSSGMETTMPMSGGNKALVPVSGTSDSLSCSHLQWPDSREDIKPPFLPSIVYMDQSPLPGPSSY